MNARAMYPTTKNEKDGFGSHALMEDMKVDQLHANTAGESRDKLMGLFEERPQTRKYGLPQTIKQTSDIQTTRHQAFNINLSKYALPVGLHNVEKKETCASQIVNLTRRPNFNQIITQ